MSEQTNYVFLNGKPGNENIDPRADLPGFQIQCVTFRVSLFEVYQKR